MVKIPSTLQDAKSGGHPLRDPSRPRPAGGAHFETKNEGDICYVGPCEGHTREVCYFTSTGCDYCIDFADTACERRGVWFSGGSYVYERAELPELSNASRPNFCCAFYPLAGTTFWLRNNCDKCKVVLVQWFGLSYLSEYRVEAYDQIKVEALSTQGQIIGENPC